MTSGGIIRTILPGADWIVTLQLDIQGAYFVSTVSNQLPGGIDWT
jgi:hypothetical protein